MNEMITIGILVVTNIAMFIAWLYNIKYKNEINILNNKNLTERMNSLSDKIKQVECDVKDKDMKFEEAMATRDKNLYVFQKDIISRMDEIKVMFNDLKIELKENIAYNKGVGKK